jgi:hypothetical protein
MEFLEASIGHMAATWQNWALIGQSTLILGRRFWKIPSTTWHILFRHMRQSLMANRLYHLWSMCMYRPTQHDMCQKLTCVITRLVHMAKTATCQALNSLCNIWGLYEFTHCRHMADFDRTVHVDWASGRTVLGTFDDKVVTIYQPLGSGALPSSACDQPVTFRRHWTPLGIVIIAILVIISIIVTVVITTL